MIFSGKTDNAFKNYDVFVSGKQNFSFQYERKCVFLTRRVGGIKVFNTRNLGDMILLTRSAIVFMLEVTNLLK